MKKFSHLLLFVLLMTVAYSGYAQPRDKKDRVRSLKIAFITDKVKLTADQSADFWPLYNRYQDELHSMRKDSKIDDEVEMAEAVLSIKKRYKAEFLKVLSQQQLTELYRAEREFKDMLMKRLEDGPSPSGNRRK